MSRTYRKFPSRLKNVHSLDYDEDFLRKIKNGLVRVPLRASRKPGEGFAYENVWKRDAKRFWKRFLNKLVRRKNKRIDNEM